jgi:hypothetical protein
MTDFDDYDDYDDDEEPYRRARPLWVAVVAVCAVVGLVGGMFLAFDDDDPDDLPVATTAPEPASADELEVVIAEIETFVAAERGLPFQREVVVALADDDEFEARLLEDFEEDAGDLRAFGTTLVGLGLLEPDVDPVEAFRDLLGAGVVGFYDPETDELVVRGTALSPYVRSIVAHELLHALDDQHFELHRPDLEDRDDEAGFGFSALVEGNARRIQDAYVASLPIEQQRAAHQEELSQALDTELLSAPPILLGLLQSPYLVGPDFVDALLDAGGQPALDAAYSAPPTTSEQVLAPETYLAGEGEVDVAEPAADGDVVDRGTLGSLVLGVLLADDGAVGLMFGDIPSLDGWGGDSYVSWEATDGTSCTRVAVVGDSEADTIELVEQLTEWVESPPVGVEAELDTGSPGQPVTLTSCA